MRESSAFPEEDTGTLPAPGWRWQGWLLIWLSVVNREKAPPANCFKRLCCIAIFQGIGRGGTCLATFDHPDIRGLSTARPFFIAELPLSSGGNSASLIP